MSTMRLRRAILILVACAPMVTRGTAAAANKDFDQGVELYKQKHYAQAVESFKNAVNIDNNNPSAYYYLANCAYALGKRPEAIELYWGIVHKFGTTREAYYSRDFLKRIDPSYGKHSTSLPASPGPSTQSKSAATDNSSATTDKEKLIKDLLVVVRSQGNRPDVSQDLIGRVKQTLATYPAELLELLEARDIKIHLTPTTIDEDPRMQNTTPRGYEEGTSYKNCPGFFDGEKIVVCEYALRGSDDSAWEHTEDPLGTLRHELGHAFDRCLGHVSASEEFKHAYYLDVGHIDEEVKPRIAYFLQQSRNGPAETFAELMCYHFGGRTAHWQQARCQLVHSSFTEAASVAEQKLSLAGKR